MIIREERIGGQRLILGDCMKVMPLLERFDAILTDPPFGIGEGRKAATRTAGSKGDSRWRGRTPTEYEMKDWDDEVADISGFPNVPSIIWGGNYFRLPPSTKWLVWDKKTEGSDFADCELAWTNIGGAVRKFEWLWSGFRKQAPEQRWHPTQKPVALMEWCLGFLPNAKTILDPFAGSATVAVACQRLGRQSTSIEIDETYFNISCERVQKAVDQPDLFIEPPAPQPVQESLL